MSLNQVGYSRGIAILRGGSNSEQTAIETAENVEQVSAWIATQDKSQATVVPFHAFVFRDRNLTFLWLMKLKE